MASASRLHASLPPAVSLLSSLPGASIERRQPLRASTAGCRCYRSVLDVADSASVQAAAAALAEDPGRLDILINNAAAYVDWTELASTTDLDAARTVRRSICSEHGE